jgi:hypothetical protein
MYGMLTTRRVFTVLREEGSASPILNKPVTSDFSYSPILCVIRIGLRCTFIKVCRVMRLKASLGGPLSALPPPIAQFALRFDEEIACVSTKKHSLGLER